MQLLSTRATQSLKIIACPVEGAVAFLLAWRLSVLAGSTPEYGVLWRSFVMVVALSFVAAWAYALLTCYLPLKRVEMGDDCVVVSSLTASQRISLQNISSVHRSRWRFRRPIVLQLSGRSRFGTTIVFLPPLRVPSLFSGGSRGGFGNGDTFTEDCIGEIKMRIENGVC